VSKKGLPFGISMRHDSHYVEELSKPNKSIGRIISINLLEPNPEQPRTEIGNLDELSASIKEKGILEPILVKPIVSGNFMIIAGERRWRAANLAGLREVPCIELDLDEQSIAEIALIENLQRKDLTVWEEADGLAALKEKFNYKHDEIAKKISKSRSTVTELMSVAGIPAEIRVKCRELNLNSKSSLLEVARQFDEPAMYEYLERFKNKKEAEKSQHKTNLKSSSKKETAYTNNREAISDSNVLPKNIFNFNSNTNEFELQITFRNLQSYDKKNILRALKEAFDEIKFGSPE
jgi:ParB family transcriptional regulator, chromosome partitioning protein